MKLKVASAKLVLDNTRKEARKPMKIRVYYNYQYHTYPVPVKERFTYEEYSSDRKKSVKDAKLQAKPYIDQAVKICETLGADFSWEAFELMYNDWYGKGKTAAPSDRFSDTIMAYCESHDLSRSSLDLMGTATRWVESYRPGVRIGNVTPEFIIGLMKHIREKHMEKEKRQISENTMRIYLRNYRAVFNYAIETGVYKGVNPVTKVPRLSLASIPRQKAAMKEPDFKKLLEYVPATRIEAMGKDFFLATMQFSGANLGDILRLTNKNIAYGEVNFVRTKTKRSGIVTSPPLTEAFLAFLNKYGKVDYNAPDDYVLPYLSGLSSEDSIRYRVKWINRQINRGLKSICDKLGIRPVTIYNARHTFATYAKANGISIETLQRLLGHTDIRTTQIYIASITDKEMDKDRAFLDRLAAGRI